MSRLGWYVQKRLLGLEGATTVYAGWMFHGQARRYGAAYPLLEYWLGDSLEHPLWLTKNKFDMKQVFQPNLALVVSSVVKDRLRKFRNVHFLQVQLEKVFDHAYLPTDDPYPGEDEEDVIARFPDDRSLHGQLGEWYEVVVPKYSDVASPYAGRGVVREIPDELSSRPLKIEVSHDLFDDYPFLWKGDLLLSEAAFECLRPDLDPRYFAVTSLSTS